MVQIHELDLNVGDILQVGDTTVTVIDIENGEVTFRIDDSDSHADNLLNGSAESESFSLPR
jgi:hypothetical protein